MGERRLDLSISMEEVLGAVLVAGLHEAVGEEVVLAF